MALVICMANSIKRQERCIAGIELTTGRWIRPVYPSVEKCIPRCVRDIKGAEPQVLDLLEIPLEDHGPDEGCQPENRLLRKGKWQRLGRMDPEAMLQYCEDDGVILHTDMDRVSPELFKIKPKYEWKSLQLVCSKQVHFFKNPWERHCASFTYGSNRKMELKVTDPVIRERLDRGDTFRPHCVLTISLGTPYQPNPEAQPFCWKLVAGVVEL